MATLSYQGVSTFPQTSISVSDRSIVTVYGESRSRCGYCGSNCSDVFGVWSERLSVEHYQAMLDAGWRRSGQYLYRPNLHTSCCQSFVIRLRAQDYAPSSSQKRVMKRLRRATAPANSDTNMSDSRATAKMNGNSARQTSARERVHKSLQIGSRNLTGCEIIKTMILKILMRFAPKEPPCREFSDGNQVALCSISLNSDVLDRLVPSITVRPCPARKKRESIHGGRDNRPFSTNLSDPKFGCNVAMLLASKERQAAKASSSDSGTRQKTSKHDVFARQMAIASVIIDEIRRSEAMSWIQDVECAPPGWINISPVHDFEAKNRATSRVEQTAPSGCHTLQPNTSQSHSCDVSSNIRVDTSSLATVTHGLESSIVENPDVAACETVSGHAAHTALLSRSSSDDLDDMNVGAQNVDMHGIDTMGSTSPQSSTCSASSDDDSDSFCDLPCLPQTNVDLTPVPSGRRFSMQFVPSRFEDDEYRLYCRYQVFVHGSKPRECRRSSYKRFLVDSPLVPQRSEDGAPVGYGSFHVRYTLDNQLFAVGVVDVLPQCLSSVYLFYDPAFSSLSPGVLSAIKEIEWVQQARLTSPNLCYYYMGYYIHTCPKMRYKAEFKPSEIVCEETRYWIPAEVAKAALDHVDSSQRTVRLAPAVFPSATALENFTLSEEELSSAIDSSLILFSTRVVGMVFLERLLAVEYAESMGRLRNTFGRFIKLVGRDNCGRFLHKLDT